MPSISQQVEGAPRTSSLDTQAPTNPIREYHVINPHTLPAKIREIPDEAIRGVVMFFYVIGNILTVGLLFGIDYAVNKVQAEVVKKLETELRKIIQEQYLDYIENQKLDLAVNARKVEVNTEDPNLEGPLDDIDNWVNMYGPQTEEQYNLDYTIYLKSQKLIVKLFDAKLALTKINSPISDRAALEIILQEYKIDNNTLREMYKLSSDEKENTSTFIPIYMKDQINEIPLKIEATPNSPELQCHLERLQDEDPTYLPQLYEKFLITKYIHADLAYSEISKIKKYIDFKKYQMKNYLEKVIKKNRANPGRATVSEETSDLSKFTDEIVNWSLRVWQLKPYNDNRVLHRDLECVKLKFTDELSNESRKLFRNSQVSEKSLTVMTPKNEAIIESIHMIIANITSRITALKNPSPDSLNSAEEV